MTTTDQPAGEPDTEGSYGASANFAADFSSLTANIATVIKGKSTVIHLMALALIADGHVLVEDVPGVGKTSLGKALARSVDGRFGRVQFTPDLLPTDVTGVGLEPRIRHLRVPTWSGVQQRVAGRRNQPRIAEDPIRLLEAMAERQVTSDGVTHQLASPFMVIATQNPIEHEGTYALPEAQLDRFLMRLEIGYPDRAPSWRSSNRMAIPVNPPTPRPGTDLGPDQRHVEFARASTWLQRCRATSSTSRRHPSPPALSLGMSPRGVLALQRIVRAHAAAEGRAYATPDDVKSSPGTSSPIGCSSHPRVACEGAPIDIVTEILDGVPVPAPAGLTCRPAPAGGCWSPEPFVVSGRLFGAIEFLVVGIAAVTAVVVAVLLRQLRPSRLSVVRQLTPPLVPVGEPARRPRGDQPSRSRSPFCDCSTPLPEPEVSILALAPVAGNGSIHGAYRLPTTVEGCSISDPSDRRCRRTRARTQATSHRHPGSADRHPPIEASADPGPGRR